MVLACARLRPSSLYELLRWCSGSSGSPPLMMPTTLMVSQCCCCCALTRSSHATDIGLRCNRWCTVTHLPYRLRLLLQCRAASGLLLLSARPIDDRQGHWDPTRVNAQRTWPALAASARRQPPFCFQPALQAAQRRLAVACFDAFCCSSWPCCAPNCGISTAV